MPPAPVPGAGTAPPAAPEEAVQEERNRSNRTNRDPLGKLQEILNKLPTGTRFEDTEFPPTHTSLAFNWSTLRHQDKWRALKWRRAEDFAPEVPVVMKEGVRPSDIQQGMLGDCYFLAALSALAGKQRSFAQQLITSNPEALQRGVSVCRLSVMGKWRGLVVSHSFPCHPWGELAFSRVLRGTGLWVPILEKAWAKLHGSYQAIECGGASEAMRALTSAPTMHYRLEEARKPRVGDSRTLTSSKILDGDTYAPGNGKVSRDAAGDTAEGVWKAITDAVTKRFPVCASCGDHGEVEHEDKNSGLIRGHAYTLLDAQLSHGLPFVLLRNPWGRGRWRGGNVERAPRYRTATGKSDGQVSEDSDGVFWMQYTDFLRQFSGVDICCLRGGYSCEAVGVRPAPGHGPTSVVAVKFSPQADSKVSISMLQPNRRRGQGMIGQQIDSTVDAMGLELLALQPGGKSATIVSSSPFHMRQEVSVDVSVQKGFEYLAIVRATPQPGEAACAEPYSVCSYSPGSLGLQICRSDPGEYRRMAYYAAAHEKGEVIFGEDGATVRHWVSEHSSVTILLFESGPSRLLASIEWSLLNLLLQEHFPLEAQPEDEVVAASGKQYKRYQVVDLEPGQVQMTVLSWVQPCRTYSQEYCWMAATKQCTVCGVPVGCAVRGRFSGEYVYFDGARMFGGGRKYVHCECQKFAKLKSSGLKHLRMRDH